LVVNLMLLAMCITLAAGELFNPVCGEGWARGWLTMYWVSFVFIFPLIPLVMRYINGYYLYWYHLLIMQVVYITHAMDVWIRGEDNVIPQYIPALTWFFIGSSAWVMTLYLTIYKYVAMLWVILGFCLVFWSADAVWRLGGPHGLEAQILLVVFNLLVTYVLCYRLWEALSPLIRKADEKLSTDEEEEKIRLTLKASFISLFQRSLSEHPRPTPKKSKKNMWNSEWTRVNSEDDGERECVNPNRRQRGTEDGVFQVETQILSDYDRSSDDEVKILIQESDDCRLSPRETPAKPVKQLIALSESIELTQQQQERLECNPLLSHTDETTNVGPATVPLLSSIATVTQGEKDIVEESKNSERTPPPSQYMKSVTPSKQVNFARHTPAKLTQSQDKLSTVAENEEVGLLSDEHPISPLIPNSATKQIDVLISEVELNKVQSKADIKVAGNEPNDAL